MIRGLLAAILAAGALLTLSGCGEDPRMHDAKVACTVHYVEQYDAEHPDASDEEQTRGWGAAGDYCLELAEDDPESFVVLWGYRD